MSSLGALGREGYDARQACKRRSSSSRGGASLPAEERPAVRLRKIPSTRSTWQHQKGSKPGRGKGERSLFASGKSAKRQLLHEVPV